MVQTAKFVKGAGRQSIFVLRVKQANNPNFMFLMPQDRLHPYFEWLLDADLQVATQALCSPLLTSTKAPGNLRLTWHAGNRGRSGRGSRQQKQQF